MYVLMITGNQNLVEMPNLYSWFFRPMFIEIMYVQCTFIINSLSAYMQVMYNMRCLYLHMYVLVTFIQRYMYHTFIDQIILSVCGFAILHIHSIHQDNKAGLIKEKGI